MTEVRTEPQAAHQQQKAKKNSLPKSLRLDASAVKEVLKKGRRVRARTNPAGAIARTKFSAKFLSTNVHLAAESKITGPLPTEVRSRIAIAVPKRLLKSAVCRNMVKRWVRETFRQHSLKLNRADMLITLEEKLDPKDRIQRKDAQQELNRLLNEVKSKLPRQEQSYAADITGAI